MLFIHETFLVYKLETSKNCKEAKQIMIITIAIIYFLILCDIWLTLKITSRKSSGPPEKIHSQLLTHSPLKNSKSESPPTFWPTLKNFQPLSIVCDDFTQNGLAYKAENKSAKAAASKLFNKWFTIWVPKTHSLWQGQTI